MDRSGARYDSSNPDQAGGQELDEREAAEVAERLQRRSGGKALALTKGRRESFGMVEEGVQGPLSISFDYVA